MEIEFMAESNDGRWQFILDVYAEATYPNTDPVEWDWEELIIQSHPDLDGDDDDLGLEPEPEDSYLNMKDDDDLRLEPELDEQNTLAGAGSGASVTTGDGFGYMGKNSFKKNKKK